MTQLGSDKNPLRIAIVGSGPSGFYAAEALIKSNIDVKVDMLERLPSPYGLVRSGVAPDHPKLKQAILLYDKIAQSPAFNLIANVTVGNADGVRGNCRRYHDHGGVQSADHVERSHREFESRLERGSGHGAIRAFLGDTGGACFGRVYLGFLRHIRQTRIA